MSSDGNKKHQVTRRHRGEVPRFGMRCSEGPMSAQVYIDLNPVFHHVQEFLRLRCAPDLLELGVYPRDSAAKEITESMAAFSAVRRVLGVGAFGRDDIRLLDVGAGRSPRTGALFAFRSRWGVTCIDPLLDAAKWGDGRIRRVDCIAERVQDIHVKHDGLVVLTLVHAHVEVLDAINSIEAPQLLVVALPCCTPHELSGLEPILKYPDFGCWSPQRTIKVWNIDKATHAQLIAPAFITTHPL